MRWPESVRMSWGPKDFAVSRCSCCGAELQGGHKLAAQIPQYRGNLVSVVKSLWCVIVNHLLHLFLCQTGCLSCLGPSRAKVFVSHPVDVRHNLPFLFC